MAWSRVFVETLTHRLGHSVVVHAAFPPMHLGGSMASVAEFSRPDGTTVYATVGASEPPRFTTELLLRSTVADPRLVELLARLGPQVGLRGLGHGHTLPLAGPPDAPPPFDGVGLCYAGQLQAGETSVRLLAVVGLTSDELAAARTSGLPTVLVALDLDGQSEKCTPGRPTSPSLASLLPVRPDPEALAGLSTAATAMVDAIFAGDFERIEGLRKKFGEGEARTLARLLGERLASPDHLADLLHGLMDFSIPELATPCMRLLQLDPTHPMATQYYCDALALLTAIEGGRWEEGYERYQNFDEAQREAERRRVEAGLPIRWSGLARLRWPMP